MFNLKFKHNLLNKIKHKNKAVKEENNYIEFIDTPMSKEFKLVTDNLYNLFLNKNSDYGSSVDITYLMFGDVAQLIRLWDKLLRLTQLHLSNKSLIKSETYDDSLLDLANYAIIALAQKRVYSKDDLNNLGLIFENFVKSALAKKEGR